MPVRQWNFSPTWSCMKRFLRGAGHHNENANPSKSPIILLLIAAPSFWIPRLWKKRAWPLAARSQISRLSRPKLPKRWSKMPHGRNKRPQISSPHDRPATSLQIQRAGSEHWLSRTGYIKSVERHCQDDDHCHQPALGVPRTERSCERHVICQLVDEEQHRQRHQSESIQDVQIDPKEWRSEPHINQRILRPKTGDGEQQRGH